MDLEETLRQNHVDGVIVRMSYFPVRLTGFV